MRKIMSDLIFIERVPTVEEYAALIASVGWKEREPEAIRLALGNSLYAVCARFENQLVGMGRVIGDGGLHYYLSDVVVLPNHQHKGIGTRIVNMLNHYLDTLPYRSTLVGIIAGKGTREFYERCGYTAQNSHSPAMYRWVNREDA